MTSSTTNREPGHASGLARALRRESVVGLQAGDGLIIGSQLHADQGGRVYIQKAAFTKYPADVTGEDLARLLRKFWKTSGFTTRTVATCLCHRTLQIKHTRFPHLEPEEIRPALLLDAEETLQLESDALCYDWFSLPGAASGKGQQTRQGMEGILTAVPRHVVDRHVELLRHAHLFPLVVEVGAVALGNLYLAIGQLGGLQGNTEPVALIHAMPHGVEMCIVDAGLRLYPQRIVTRSAEWQQVADYLVDGIVTNLKHYQYALQKKPVCEILVTGTMSNLTTFIDLLQEQAHLLARFWDPTEKLGIHRPIKDQGLTDGHLYSLSLGAALRR